MSISSNENENENEYARDQFFEFAKYFFAPTHEYS